MPVVAVTLLALLAAGPSKKTLEDSPRFTWDVPQVIQRSPVEGQTRSSGIPIRLEAVRSKLSIDQLLQHFATSFEKAGLYLPPTEHQPQLSRALQLNALDVRRLISYSVILQPNSDGSTSVILGEADLFARRQELTSFPPIYPGGSRPVRMTTEGGAVISYLAGAAGSQIDEFYKRSMAAHGFSARGDGIYERGEESVRMRVMPPRQSGDKATVVLIHRAAAPELSAPPGPPPPKP